MFKETRAQTRMRAQWAGRVAILSVAAAIVAAKGCLGNGASPSASAGSSSPVSASTITVQPVSQAVSAGAAVTLSVAATGDGTLNYQWYKASKEIPGAISSRYAIASAASGDAGTYDVVVTNGGGSTASSSATLTVGTTTTASCDAPYLDSVLGAVSTLEAALGSSLASSTLHDSSTLPAARRNVHNPHGSNLPPSRPGITLASVTTAAQVAAFDALAKTALGTQGYADFQGVLAADETLGHRNDISGDGADPYHVAFVGTPSGTGAWTLMLGGRQRAFNITFDGACASPAPHLI
jgi:hypothetical protein